MTAKKFNNLETLQSIRGKLNEHADFINENKEAIENIGGGGSGDMLKSTYDPANGSRQVAFFDDARFSDSREWNANTVTQAEAETGTATTRRAFTAQRVRQSVIAWWNTITLAISDITGLQTELNAKANSNAVVNLSTAQTVGGQKTFSMLTDNNLGTTGGTVAINWANGLNQKIVLNANTTFTFSNPRQGHVHEILLTQGNPVRTITFPTITWQDATAPTINAVSGTYLIQLTYRGTTYYGAVISFNA